MQPEKRLAVHVLASGSSGNATLVTYGASALLIDAGISCKRIVEGMRSHGVEPEQIEGIFLTHEHGDHVQGVQQMLKRFQTPVYTRKATWDAMYERVEGYTQFLRPLTDKPVQLQDLVVESFSISHDAADPVGFSCYGGHHKMTYVTDTGVVTDSILGHMHESELLVLEANHDTELLRMGPYPLRLQQRVAGPEGHLVNEMAAAALLGMRRPDAMQVILAHRSEHNNSIPHVDRAMETLLTREGLHIGKDISLMHAMPKTCVSIWAKENTCR